MTVSTRIATLTMVFACCASISVAEQGAGPRQPGPAPGSGPAGGHPTEQQREKVRKKVEAVRLARLTEVLQLDEKTAAKFIPVVTAIDQKRRALLKENQQTMQELKIMLHATPPDEAKLKAAIASLDRNRREIVSLRDKEFSAARDSLTVTQTARYLLFNQEFQQEMRGMVEGARSSPRRGGMGPGKAGPEPKSP